MKIKGYQYVASCQSYDDLGVWSGDVFDSKESAQEQLLEEIKEIIEPWLDDGESAERFIDENMEVNNLVDEIVWDEVDTPYKWRLVEVEINLDNQP